MLSERERTNAVKILHIFRTEPISTTLLLAQIISGEAEFISFELFNQSEIDYDRLIDLLFSCDKSICW